MNEPVKGTQLSITKKAPNGLILEATVERGDIPALETYAPGCVITNLNNGKVFINIGTAAAPAFAEQVSSGTVGDLLFFNGTSFVALPIGDEGQVLTVVNIQKDEKGDPILVPSWESA